MGETAQARAQSRAANSFSILERIVMGETPHVSIIYPASDLFQYPRTDRDG